ncbi:hypothetical protein [Endozoicomonas sp. GU-1]|nr:hypothetical protein [Endozoicomonas sp. GU-1]WBA87890.1 hypothetical protein O3276_07750 [Endozoicomonas sp. GU-1]
MQSPSSSVTADTASPLTATEAGRHWPANSRKQKRKRSMSGYQVKQTTTGTGTFPPHQLQSESGPIPSIKRRRVTDNSRRIVCSATSLPTEINSGTSISEFSVSQQNELRTHLNNQEIQAILTNAGTLLKNLKDRNIQLARDRGKPPAHSLFSRLKNFSIVKDSQTFKGYFARANTFFLAVNPQQITNTSCLTSMLKSKTQIKKFAEESEENIQAVAANPCLKQIASMCNGKGLPDKAKVEAFVAWQCWKVNGEFSLELLRAFSSMMSRKGLPDKAKVEAFVAWECWKVNDEFSLELLRAFSSMMSSRGLPDKAKVEALKAWECWKVNGEFSLELLRAFSSMCHGKGLPDKAKVEALKAWECWKVNGEFSLELLRAFSSMCHGKGLPDKAKVTAFVAWECWKVNGKFSLELLRAFSSMCHGKGLPDKAKVEAFVQWLPSDENKNILKLSFRIFASFGLPSAEKLTENEKTLRQCLNQHGCTTEHGDDNSDEDLLESSQIKALALFFSGPAKWRMKIAEFQQYLAAHKSPRHDRVAVRAALQSLLPILAIHGGTGIPFWMEKYRENPRCKGVLTKALSIPAPLALTKFALTQLPESERQEYLELCRNLKPAPTQEQWYALKPLYQQLGQRFDFTQSKRTMLEILWQQSEDNRSKYADKMDELFKTLPTISQWRGLHRVLGPHKMQQFMDACLDYQATPETAPDVTIQQRLLAGMLLTNHSLPEPEKIPDLCFSNRVATDDKRGVMVGGDPAMSGQERLWRFITAMLIELEQTEYQFKNQRLTVLPDDGDPVVLQNPEFTPRDTGFVIKNWTLQQLTAFFKATEFTEQWYKKPQDKRDLYAIRLEAKLAQMKARTKEPKKAKPKKIPHLVTPSMIIRLINCHKPLKPAVWSSLEHYASSGQLNARLCTALGPVIKDDKDGIVPDLVKKAVVAKLEQEAAKTPVVTSIPQQGLPARASIPTQRNQVANSRIQGPLSNF